MVLRQISLVGENKKIFLQANKDETCTKIKFVIDMDNVEQVKI